MEITLDTHTFIWYLDKKLNSKLSNKAFQTIKKAEEKGVIYIPVIVLMEILHLVEKERIKLPFNQLLSDIEKSNNYKIIPFDSLILKAAKTIKGLEVHDRLILAITVVTKSFLISKDKEIHNNADNVIW